MLTCAWRGLRCLVIGGGGAGSAGPSPGPTPSRRVGRGGRVDAERAAAAAADVRAAGRPAYALTGDVRSADDVDAMVTGAAEAFDGLDVLVTVVGGQVAFVPAVRLHEMSDADWDLIYDVNLRYVARAVRAALRVFLAQGTGGAVVAVGSVTGFMAAPEQGGYGAAKAGVLSLARTVAAEYAADRIRMNVVAAGAISTARRVRADARRDRPDPPGSLRHGGRRRSCGGLPRLAGVVVRDRATGRRRRRCVRARPASADRPGAHIRAPWGRYGLRRLHVPSAW